MARYRYTAKSVFFTGATGQKIRIARATQQELQKVVRKANRLRKNTLKQLYENDPRSSIMDLESYEDILSEEGLLPEKFSQRLSQFRSSKEIRKYIKKLKKETEKGFKDYSVRASRTFWINRVEEYGGNDPRALQIVKRIEKLNDTQVREMFIGYDFLPYLSESERNNQDILQGWLNTASSQLDLVEKKNVKRKGK